ncbi:polycystin-1 [Heteronotia binoei]|uniref:polycystin-1 n=1 Tax=Heteronotia binoei TaxID=13085 RepID=UPI00292E4DFD|nr:polycystin-1 [Heteronotia binoei]
MPALRCLRPAAAASPWPWPGWCLVCCLLGGGLAAGRPCQPCGPDCACRSLPGAGPACAVDCAARAWARLPAAPWPQPTVALNLSSNKISVLNAETFAHLTSLTKLDLSNNKISTLEDGVFDNLFNLSEINLSLNPFLCDCNLAWLPLWLDKRKLKIVRPLDTKCAQPPEVAGLPIFNVSFTDTTCGADYIACLTDNATRLADSIVRFVYHLPQNWTEEFCGAQCYAERQDYGGFSDDGHCLCGAALESNSSMDCLPFCTEPFSRPVCGGPSIISNIFLAQMPISLSGPRSPSSLYQAVTFNVSVPLAVGTFQWDFGDQTRLFSTTKAAVLHKYSLPGRYNVTATAFVGSRFTSAQTEIEVVAPPAEIELQCPPLVKTNESLQLRIRNRGGTGLLATYNMMAQDGETEREVHPMCPPDSVVFPENNHCYQLVAEKAEWLEAQRYCQEFGNGDLAFVSSPEIQNFLVSRVTRSLDVWIGFNDMASPGGPRQEGEGFDLQSCQNWLPGEPHPSNADHCVRMGPAGQCNTDLCMAKHSYVCEYKPKEILLNTEYFVLGTPTFDIHTVVSNVTEKNHLSAPSGPVETMVFPNLTFQQRGFLVALEFVTQELLQTVQVRFQVYRPELGEGCKAITNITGPPVSSQGNGTWPPLDCPPGFQWCSWTNSCLPVDSCCDPGMCVNSSLANTADPSPCLHENHLWNRLLQESFFDVPPGPSTQYLLLFRGKDVSVRPNDTISIQHDTGSGAFLLCRPSRTPSGQIHHLTLNSSDWDPGSSAHNTARSRQNSVCFLRVLYVAEETVPVISPKNSGVGRYGLYTVKASVDNGVFVANLSCNFWAVAPVQGLHVVYPPVQDGKIYVPTDSTWLLVEVSSGVNASAGWLGGNQNFPFERHCPPAVALLVVECARETNDSWFSVIPLDGIGQNFSTVVLWARNAVSSQNISVVVKAEEPIRGLRATPDPETRVLLNKRVSYIPMMDAGSDVTFRWMVDDKPSFTFYNNVFKVVYQTPAVYKLSLTASNHVSNVTVDYNITVEKMNRMKDLVVSEIPSLVPQNTTIDLSAVVMVDSAVDATFLWDFGDGDQVAFQFMPPYNESFLMPDPSMHQVVIAHNVSHTYQEPGQYTLVVSVFNEFENLTYSTPVQIYAFLLDVTMEAITDVLVVGRPVTFEAYPLPSSFGVFYSWDFGDGCMAFVESQPTIVHTYSHKGMYNVSLRANNSISAVEVFELYRVFEEIRGLQVAFNEVIELRTPVEINASVETGDNITWIFDMGDGTVLESSVGSVKHIYLKEVNCTVNVTAVNPVNSVSRAVPVQIFVLMVLKIEPSSCVVEHPEVQLTAYVSGDPTDYIFDWTFGDGSSNVTVYGDPMVTHNFTRSGVFSLSLVLSSKVNKAHYYTVVCVEPEITNVTLFSPLSVILGNDSKFQVTALPPYNYHYLWDFGANDSARCGGTEISYMYKTPGSYLVTVTVSNNVSFNNVTAIVKVLEPIGVAKIESNGSKVLELNQIYLFSANVSGTNVSYLWDLGDGTSQLGKSITHLYNKTGVYTISLRGWNEVSHTEARLNVTVKRRLQGLAINASKTIVPLNGSVSFTATLLAGTAIRYSWILCDRCTPIPGTSTISYTFRSVGTFNVIVTAENEIGSLQDSIFICVLQQIEGLQVISGDLLEDAFFPTNKTLQLQAVVREGTNISYSWSALKEGYPAQTFTGKIFSLLVMEAGVYIIHLKATNMLGSVAVNKTVEFIEQIGVLKPVASPNPGAVNVSLNISVSVTAGTGLAYTWYLEDGVVLVTSNPFVIYSFQSPGVKVIMVTAENRFGSANATLCVGVQEPIVGLKIQTVNLDRSYVRSGSVVNFQGELERGTDVSWKWKLQNRSLSGQRVALEFPTAGFYSVCLNASNEVSWETACHNITVQDAIQGLQLRVSKEVVEPEEEVSFVIEMSSGSSVSYGVSIGGEPTAALNASSFTHAFAQVGDYRVQVTAENLVSVVQVEVRIVVLESISGLQIVDCCELGTPTRVERHFTAEIEKGSRVSYLWQFSLEEELRHSQSVLEGKSVSYTPEAAGLLEIHLTAINGLGSLNVSVVIQVQDPIMHFSLKPVEPFANRTSLFEASVFPSARQVVFWWQFGDGSPAQKSIVTSASHTYVRPGEYLVVVNATNLISFAITHLTVTVRVLECEEPEAELVLPAQVVMKRSQKNYLEAQIDLRGCFRYQTKYLWEIYRVSSCLWLSGAKKVRLPAVDVSRPQLVIPKLALDLGNYCFKFRVSFGDTPLFKSIFANVTVVPNKLVPIIDGGSYRVWSSTRDLILDGEKSYDPNLEDLEQTPLHYRWTCVSSTKSPSGGCALNFSAAGGGVTVSRAILETDVEYTFDLTVWKTGMSPEATNQTVLIKEGTVPIVALECVSCKAQSVYEVSRSSYVYLEGTCLNCQNNSKLGRWAAHSFKNKTLVLDKTTTSTGNVGMNLVLRPGALKDGEGYTFTLHVTDLATGEEGFASIDLFPNQPPFGGFCRLSPLGSVQALMAKVHFECTGWRDNEDEDTPLVYLLLATRCRTGHCEEFWVYKGSHSEHAAFLPPGFQEGASLVHVSVLVQDQLGATVVALNSTMAITLPSTPDGFHSLPQWLYNQTDVVLQGLVKQNDPQQVIEYSLALITILNEYERTLPSEARAEDEEDFRAKMRRNITETLNGMKVNTVDDIRQITAALAQCTVANKEFVCRACLTDTLKKLESMLIILQGETLQGTMTPTSIADNILSIMGDLIHLVNTVPQPSKSQGLNSGPNAMQVASKAYALSTDLMRILMKSRVLNEEPLELAGSDITAKGKRSDPFSLLCYWDSPSCRFSIPRAFNATFSDLRDVVQVMIRVDYNPFPFGYIPNYTVSSEVASMEFQNNNGTEIPVGSLGPEKAITVMVSDLAAKNITAGTVTVEERKWVNVVLTTENSNRDVGLYFQVTFSVINDRYVSHEPEPFIAVYLHRSAQPNEHNCTASKKIRLEDVNRMAEGDPRRYTFFVSPVTEDAAKDYYLNITNHFLWSPVEVTLGLYSSLCQYFDEEEECWKTEGMAPLEGTTPNQAVCLTQHLTAFGASLFVPPHSVQFIQPPPGPGLNYIVLLTCAICLVTYSVAAVIVHKLDLIDINRVGVIPFCGKNGLYKYEILVKTGWGSGSGTTAHVGITLYGMDHKSGHRHLDSEDAFRRNSLDIFQIATEQSLGTVWKIRIWHDNKGLSPSWYLQHVIVRDLQTWRSFHFLVNDWLSVESEENNGLVEREVFAASEADLRSFFRIFVGELQRGFFEKHIWLSLWDRPPRSRFTRVQRASCCCLLVFLFLCANAVWYGVVGDVNFSDVAVSTLIPVSGETITVGLVSSLVVYPLYLVLLFLFRMARSKVSVSQSLTHSDQQSLEIDNYLDSSLLESSFLTFPGLRTEAFSEQTKTDVFLDDSKSLIRWHSNEALPNWPDLLSDPSIMGNTIQKLKRGRTSRHLGLEAPLATEEDGLSLGLPHAQTRYFSASDEDLIRQILADGTGSISHPLDAGQYSRVETDLLSGLSSMFGEKTEAIMMQRLNAPNPGRELNCSAKSTRTVVDHALRKRLLPFWCSHLAQALSLTFLAVCFGVSSWIGVTFTSSVALMWLISGIFSFLSSFLFWEPFKVLLEALYISLVAKRLHPEEDDTLVEYPLVEHVSEKIGKVRPPQGFALFQAKEEARKVKLLHRMLKTFLIYMLFLLAALLTNYGDASLNSRAFLLQSAIKRQTASDQFLHIKRPDEFWVWMSQGLLPHLYNNHSGARSFSITLGAPQLRQIRLQEECLSPVGSILSWTDLPAAEEKCISGSNSFDTSSYAVGWKSVSDNLTQLWAHSPPELAGVWFWGFLSFYDSGGYTQELGATLEETKSRLDFLQRNNWISNKTQAVFVELTQYNPGLALSVVVTFRLEFPVVGQVLPAVTIGCIPFLPLHGGVTLQLLMMVILMIVVVYCVVSESLSIQKAGRAYFGQAGSYSQWALILLATCTAGVYVSQATLAQRQWAAYLRNQQGFTSFYQVASLNTTFRCLAALLLFLLTVKASQQLRFIRQWSTFGRTLQRSAKELFATGLAFTIITLAYAQLGFLLFSSRSESFCTFSSSLRLLFVALRSSINLRFCLPEPVGFAHLFCASYVALELWVVVRLFAAVLLHHYRETRFEMYRPAFESQDYEMVELFVRRLKMWMGVSKAKEFRHKVRFEGMEPLPSRSSSQDSRSLRGPTPSAISDSASTSSSQLDGLSLAPSARDSSEADGDIQHLLSLLEILLVQFDRVNEATEDVYHIERRLEAAQSRRARKRDMQSVELPGSQPHPKPTHLGLLSPQTGPGGSQLLPSCPLSSSAPSRTGQASQGLSVASSLLSPHKTYASLMPMDRKKKKSLRANNRVHPSGK